MEFSDILSSLFISYSNLWDLLPFLFHDFFSENFLSELFCVKSFEDLFARIDFITAPILMTICLCIKF